MAGRRVDHGMAGVLVGRSDVMPRLPKPVCGKCGLEKKGKNAYWKKGRKHPICRNCQNAAHRRYYTKNREKRIAYTKAYNKQHPKKYALWQRRVQYKRRYGITPDDYASMLEEQNEKCKICLASPENGPRKGLVVDHDHTTGVVRGLLCQNCNALLGLSNDCPTTLMKAAHYLRNQA